MPRRTLGGGIAVNLTLDEGAVELLRRYAPTRRSYGRFVSDLILGYREDTTADELRQRVERLEATVGLTQP